MSNTLDSVVAQLQRDGTELHQLVAEALTQRQQYIDQIGDLKVQLLSAQTAGNTDAATNDAISKLEALHTQIYSDLESSKAAAQGTVIPVAPVPTASDAPSVGQSQPTDGIVGTAGTVAGSGATALPGTTVTGADAPSAR